MRVNKSVTGSVTMGKRAKGPPGGFRRIRSKAEYAAAVIRLEQLQSLPLGTLATEGLQALAEAILDYEERAAVRLAARRRPPR